ncbi:MAG: hypothetical protein EZS28_007934 [Streblomastix strix]|uniref:Uncharacterized protein n=1 Tax=Streblomastix strix TaxID=222440 RepID=A0A5J4WN83_9EUKA|nr:MAG: hypothetical protein EZS28_007934 [Streblomastix strix]
MRRFFYRQILAGIVIIQITQQVQIQQHVALPIALNGVPVYLVPLENNAIISQSKNCYLDSTNDQVSIVKVRSTSFSTGVTSAAKQVAPVFHKVMGAVLRLLGAINPKTDMIVRRVGGAVGMANKFLN